MNIEFLKPARMDDVLEVVTEPHEVKGASDHGAPACYARRRALFEQCAGSLVAGGRARPNPKPLRIAMEGDRLRKDGIA